MQSSDFEDFDEGVGAFVSERGLAGAVVVVVEREQGIVHTRAHGKFEPDRAFLAGFSSRLLSAGVIMALHDAGTVDLDAPIGQYVPSWGTQKGELSLASLLSNSSGLVSLTEDPLYAPYLCQYQEGRSLIDCAESIYTADDLADLKPPDTRFADGGAQWQLAGGVAEAVGEKPWAELTRATYAPCGVDSLAYTNPFARATPADNGSYPGFFQAEQPAVHESVNPSIEGGAYLTAADYGRLLRMHLRHGKCGDIQVLSEAAVARMQEDRIARVYGGSAGDENTGYGLGWFIDRAQPGVFYAPGAYGSMAWLDETRGYAAWIALEADVATGSELATHVKPMVDAVFD